MNNAGIEKLLNYTFKDKSLLQRALTHPSFYNEQNENYQKLEFLGDSILDFVVAEYLYQKFIEKGEGELTRLRASIVSKDALSEFVKETGMDKFALIGPSQKGMSAKMRSDIYEAIVAAIFIDSGLDEVRKFVNETIIKRLSMEEGDFKSKILEYAAKKSLKVFFETAGEGQPHKRRFTSTLFIDNKSYGIGSGYSKKEAEQNAAKEAILSINN